MFTQSSPIHHPTISVANSKAINGLYSIAERFAYGKKLAKEALNRTFREPGTGQWKTYLKRAPAESLFSLFRECSRWTELDWLSKDNWKRFRNALSSIIFPDKFMKLKDKFELKGIRACSLSEETVAFIKKVSSSWTDMKTRSASSRVDIQYSIDLLEMMIGENLVEASLRRECIKHLMNLCRRYRHIPKALELAIQDTDYSSKNPFDCGGSSDIMHATSKGQAVAVKFLRADKAVKVAMKKRNWSPLHEEALNWIGLDYPGLNPFLGITLKPPRGKLGIGLVFKYQELGNSVKYLENDRVDNVDFVRKKASHLVGTIHYLHQMGLVHADIKGANILVDSDGKLVLTDFGLMCRMLSQGISETPMSVTSTSSTTGGDKTVNGDYTLRFSSKERVFSNERSEKDDIWAIGMTLIELLTGKPPFIEKYNHDPAFTIALWNSELYIQDARLPESVPPELFDLVQRCIAPRPEDRPTTFEVYSIMGRVAGSRSLSGAMKAGYS